MYKHYPRYQTQRSDPNKAAGGVPSELEPVLRFVDSFNMHSCGSLGQSDLVSF